MSIADVATRMLETYPRDFNVSQDALVRCIEACYECGQACTQCADACLSGQGKQPELAKCIRLNLDCADVCITTGRIVSRQTEYDANLTRPALEACIAASKSCGDECERHGEHMEHCAVCAQCCRACEEACRGLLAGMR